MALSIVQDHRASKSIIPGIGHNLHKKGDPRTPVLFDLAAQHNLSGRYVDLMKRIEMAAEREFGKRLPINATGAIGAIGSELGLPWEYNAGDLR